MTIGHTPLTLQQQIEAFKRQRGSAPITIASTKASQDLIASGLADRSIKQGEKAPDFVLPDVNGENVQISHLLTRGPVVLIFYRGGLSVYAGSVARYAGTETWSHH